MSNFLDQARDDLVAAIEARDAKQDELDKFASTLRSEERRATDDEQPLVDLAIDELRTLQATVDQSQKTVDDLEAVQASRDAAKPAMRRVKTTAAAGDILADRDATPIQLRDAVLRSAEEYEVDDTNIRRLFKRHGRDIRWARNLVARSTDAYLDAFQMYVTGNELALSAEQRTALSVGTNANGGFLVPTHLDPSVILTSDGSANALRPISRVVTLTEGNQWNGVTSAGVTASFDAELTEVSDDSPTFAQPNVPVHKAQAFVQASIEAFEDIGNLASDVLMMFADARDVLEGSVHCTGSGTNQPTGIFTALDANTNVEVVSTTAAVIGLVDLQGLRRAVPQRFRGRSTWVMNPTWADEIKALGTALSASYSTDITQSNTDLLLGRPVVETDDAPEVTTTTVRDNRIVIGDFSNYVIVDKPGSTSVELIPHLFNTSNNLPDGRRGWYMYWRNGADSVNDLAFRLLQDKTSA